MKVVWLTVHHYSVKWWVFLLFNWPRKAVWDWCVDWLVVEDGGNIKDVIKHPGTHWITVGDCGGENVVNFDPGLTVMVSVNLQGAGSGELTDGKHKSNITLWSDWVIQHNRTWMSAESECGMLQVCWFCQRENFRSYCDWKSPEIHKSWLRSTSTQDGRGLELCPTEGSWC